jgi:hypothetical protein
MRLREPRIRSEGKDGGFKMLDNTSYQQKIIELYGSVDNFVILSLAGITLCVFLFFFIRSLLHTMDDD